MKTKQFQYLFILVSIFIIFFVILYSASLTYWQGDRQYWKYMENYHNNGNNTITENYVNENELITNGSFQGGKDIAEKIKSVGDNQIIVVENPGNSSHVLRQQKTQNDPPMLYYLIRLPIDGDEHYRVQFWYSCDINDPNAHLTPADLEKNLIKIEIRDKDHRLVNIQGDTVVSQRRKIHEKLWYLVSYHFKTPTDKDMNDKLLYLYLGYGMPQNIDGARYFTNVSLRRFLTDAPGFKLTKGLTNFLEGKCIRPEERIHQITWKDISEHGNDFNWQRKPHYHPHGGYYRTHDNKLIGPIAKSVIPSNLSFSFMINTQLEKTKSMHSVSPSTTLNDAVQQHRNRHLKSIVKSAAAGATTSGADMPPTPINPLPQQLQQPLQDLQSPPANTHVELINIPGNNQYSIKVHLPIMYGPIHANVAGQQFITTKSLTTTNNNVYIFEYDGKYLRIYVNDSLFDTLLPKNKIHVSEHQPIIINDSELLNAKLFNVMFYDRVLKHDEKRYLLNYLRQSNVDAVGSGMQISHYHNYNGDVNDYGDQMQVNHVGNISTSFKLGRGQNSGSGSSASSGSQSNNICPVCTLNVEECNCNNHNHNNPECPKVVYKNNKFWVFVRKGSLLEKKVGYCGYKSYGSNQANARKIFQINFPDCQVPKILKEPIRHRNFNKCPYIILDKNPCFTSECKDVDWAYPDADKISMKCKKNINHYCESYADIDPNCRCWKPEYRNMPACEAHRKKFIDPSDYKCSIRNYKIEEHPDINDYIRKDKIPCWGCSL